MKNSYLNNDNKEVRVFFTQVFLHIYFMLVLFVFVSLFLFYTNFPNIISYALVGLLGFGVEIEYVELSAFVFICATIWYYILRHLLFDFKRCGSMYIHLVDINRVTQQISVKGMQLPVSFAVNSQEFLQKHVPDDKFKKDFLLCNKSQTECYLVSYPYSRYFLSRYLLKNLYGSVYPHLEESKKYWPLEKPPSKSSLREIFIFMIYLIFFILLGLVLQSTKLL